MSWLLKWFLIVYVSISSLLPGMATQEFAKLPLLWEHYHHHQTQHGDTNGFIDFLSSHYTSLESTADAEHESLPLFNLSEFASLNMPIYFGIQIWIPNYIQKIKIITEVSIYFRELPTLLRPPR